MAHHNDLIGHNTSPSRNKTNPSPNRPHAAEPTRKTLVTRESTHETVNHSGEEWVRGDVHTNTVENVWSLLKRSIIGAYHHVSVKHLDAYLDELEWRFNNRDNPFLFRDTLLRLLNAEHVEYKELVA